MLDTPCSEVVWRVLATVQSTTGSRVVRINGSNAGYMFRGSVKGTGYPLHLPVFPLLPLWCVTVFHHISTGLYNGTCLKRNRGIMEPCICWNRVIWSSDDPYLPHLYKKRKFLQRKNISGPSVSVISRFLCTTLTLILLTWRIWWAPNARRWQMGFNLAFKRLRLLEVINRCVVHSHTLPSLYSMFLSAVCRTASEVCGKVTDHQLHYSSKILVLCYS
jgi:hypothetical protein